MIICKFPSPYSVGQQKEVSVKAQRRPQHRALALTGACVRDNRALDVSDCLCILNVGFVSSTSVEKARSDLMGGKERP